MAIQYPFIPYVHSADETLIPDQSALGNYLFMNQRRSVRDFSDKPISETVISNLILAAGTAPSGAHKQPWTFCAVSNPDLKKAIRKSAENEEYENYHGRMSEEWIRDLAPLGTDWKKEFLEIAPWLIIVFKKPYDLVQGEKHKNYYVSESVGIACGFLIQAIHEAGLVCLTHTPSPMNFLQKILNRPEEEKAFLLIPVGYPSSAAMVPDIKRKKLDEIAAFYR
jgi:iodotyrosine deiodinase